MAVAATETKVSDPAGRKHGLALSKPGRSRARMEAVHGDGNRLAMKGLESEKEVDPIGLPLFSWLARLPNSRNASILSCLIVSCLEATDASPTISMKPKMLTM